VLRRHMRLDASFLQLLVLDEQILKTAEGEGRMRPSTVIGVCSTGKGNWAMPTGWCSSSKVINDRNSFS
jgi:hypothetical protein